MSGTKQGITTQRKGLNPKALWALCFEHALNQAVSLRKSVGIPSYSGLHFPAFGLNTERYEVSVRMRENADQNNSEYEHFSRSEYHCLYQRSGCSKWYLGNDKKKFVTV